jgi:paraquat-inducible protein A
MTASSSELPALGGDSAELPALRAADRPHTTRTAAGLGLLSCPSCKLLSRKTTARSPHCPRCGVRLRLRKRESLVRTSAFLAAAAILYVPANLLPIMTTSTLTKSDADTILSGCESLWRDGSWPLAILVFVASIAVPVLKICALGLLVVTSWWRSTWRPRERTRLYRMIELVGRWSMMDVFVMGMLTALVHTRTAGVEINSGAIAFGAVVVLTMFSSQSFDPRLIWEPIDHDHA